MSAGELISVTVFNLIGLYMKVVVACDIGWSSYGEHCYRVVKSLYTWDAASSDCISRGAYLVVITDSNEDTFVANLGRSENGGINKNLWIDGRDIAVEGIWRFSNNVQLTYINWGTNEPNGGSYHDCLGMWSSHNMKWDDYTCTHGRWFVCEKEDVTTTQIITTTEATTSKTTTTVVVKPINAADTTTTVAGETASETITTVSEEPTTAAETTTTVTEKPTIAAETTTIVTEEPTTAAEPTTTIAEEPTTAAETTTTVTEKPTTAAETTTTNAEPSTTTESTILTTSVDTSLTSTESTGSCKVCIYCSSMTDSELEDQIKLIREDLSIDKKNTNVARRKLTCANDDRPSAQAIGYSGLAFLCVVLCICICGDLEKVLRLMIRCGHKTS